MSARAPLIAFNVTRGVRLTQCARVADNVFTRLVGLLRHKQLELGDGLWIVPCNSIHSLGMRFEFDAVFLDRGLRVVHLMSAMKTWRISPMIWSAHSVLEVPTGIILQTATQLGDQFEMKRESIAAAIS